MPYTITTKRAQDPEGFHRSPGKETVAQRAVIGHDQMRAEAWEQTYLVCVEMEYDQSWLTTARELGENGGTVGPLPNGTIIQVERTP